MKEVWRWSGEEKMLLVRSGSEDLLVRECIYSGLGHSGMGKRLVLTLSLIATVH